MGRRLAERVLLLGWSGADWQAIRPLLDSGRMPYLEQLVNEGAMGHLATLRPAVSPMLWTSITTGKRADEHGVHGHVEIRPDGAGTRPVTSTSLRARPLWQILEAYGQKSAVVGWDATYPASAVGGIAVSGHIRTAQGTRAATWPMPPDSVAPPTLHEVMRGLRVHPADITADQIAYFLPEASPEALRDRRVGLLRVLLAQIATLHAAGTWIAERESWDLLAVQYDALDIVGRESPRDPEAAPSDAGRDTDDVGLYRDVVARLYEFFDAMLGRYMRLVGPETTIMIVSEHGLSSRWRFGLADLQGSTKEAYRHRPYGILVARGPSVPRDQLVFGATLLDVAPTVLTMLGVPIGRDMEGRALPGMFVEPIEPTYVESHGAPVVMEDPVVDDPADVEAAVRHLESLGYTRPPVDHTDVSMEQARLDRMFNLAEAHFARERWKPASDLFASVLTSRPEHAMAQFRLVQCRLRLGDVNGGRALAGDFLSHDIDSPWAHLALGLIDAFEERWDGALDRFDRAREESASLPDIHYRTGAVRLHQKQWAEAEAAFRRSLDEDGESAHAYHGLGLAIHAQRRYGEAAETLMRSIGLVYHQPAVHFHLGAALYGAGYVEAAIESLETALRFDPSLGEAHGILARVLRRKGDLVRAAHHEAAGALHKHPSAR